MMAENLLKDVFLKRFILEVVSPEDIYSTVPGK